MPVVVSTFGSIAAAGGDRCRVFLPNVNGVTNSVLRILEYLSAQGHDAVVIAPGPHGRTPDNRGSHGRGPDHPEISHYAGFRVVRVPTIRLPFVDSLPIGVPTPTVYRTLTEFRPDIVHLASPFALGRGGGWAARRLGIPRVAVFRPISQVSPGCTSWGCCSALPGVGSGGCITIAS